MPQGGINSSILFDFAMHFMLEEFVVEHTNSDNEKDVSNNHISEENSFLYADDTTFAFRYHATWIEVKQRLKNFISILRKKSKEWGLQINFKKSGLVHFLPLQPRLKNYTDLSDEVCKLDQNYEGTLVWNYPSEPTIHLPLLPK